MSLINPSKYIRSLKSVLSKEAAWAQGRLGPYAEKAALKIVNLAIGRAVPFASRNRFQVVALQNGRITAKIPLKGNKNHFGAMYAGAIFTVAEIPGGVVSLLNFDSKFFPVLKDQKIEFKKVAKSDVTITFELSDSELQSIEKQALELGKAEFTLEGEIRDSNQEVVARSFATYQIRVKS